MLVLYYNLAYRFIQVLSVVAVISSRVQWFCPGSNIKFTHPLSLVCFCMEAFYFFLTFMALAVLLLKGHSFTSGAQPFYPQGSVLWKTIFSMDQGRGQGFQDDSRHAFIVYFISIMPAPPQVIRN